MFFFFPLFLTHTSPGGECPPRLGRKAKAGSDELLPNEPMDEATFRWLLNEDEMASFKLEVFFFSLYVGIAPPMSLLMNACG